MLSVPDSVKALFKRDTVRKNVRLTWENGRADIINTQLVSESLRFRESICSSDAIAFGTAEASTLEFETVGIENLFGQWLRAYIEVDATTLAEDLQEERADLSYPVYSIPLGRFVVTSCPRNHEALAHRKFTCRGRLSVSKSLIPPAVLSSALSGIAFSQDCSWSITMNRDLLRAYLGLVSDDDLTISATRSYSYSTAPINMTRYKTVQLPFYSQGHPSASGTAGVLFYVFANAVTLTDGMAIADVTGIPTGMTEAAADAAASALATNTKARFGNYIYKRSSTGTVATSQDIEEAIKPLIRSAYADVARYGARQADIYTRTAEVENLILPGANTTTDGRMAMSPAMIGTDDNDKTSIVCCPVAIGVGINNSLNYPILAYYPLMRDTTNTIKVYTMPTTGVSASTDSVKGEHPVRDGRTYSGYAVDLKEPLNQAINMLTCQLESLGGFFTMDRYGKPVMKVLSADPVATIAPAEYSSCWVEEQDLSEIGTIKFSVDDAEYSLIIGDGDSIYTLQDVSFWSAAGLTPDEIATKLMTDLAPALDNLRYTPVELDGLGLPYLEAGDRVTIQLADGSTVETFVLERNLEGLQHLSDSITADGVTVQELEAAELTEEGT